MAEELWGGDPCLQIRTYGHAVAVARLGGCIFYRVRSCYDWPAPSVQLDRFSSPGCPLPVSLLDLSYQEAPERLAHCHLVSGRSCHGRLAPLLSVVVRYAAETAAAAAAADAVVAVTAAMIMAADIVLAVVYIHGFLDHAWEAQAGTYSPAVRHSCCAGDIGPVYSFGRSRKMLRCKVGPAVGPRQEGTERLPLRVTAAVMSRKGA